MSEQSFTPGPWFIHPRTTMTVMTEDGRVVATTGGYSATTDMERVHNENEANARLIAAAPAPLEALKAVRAFAEAEVENREHAGGSMSDYINEAQEIVDTIDAAISQAEGRDHG